MDVNDLRIAITVPVVRRLHRHRRLGLVAPQRRAASTKRRSLPFADDERRRAVMSDFFSSGWSVYIAVATLVSLVACLAAAGRRERAGRAMADDNSTGHVWDEDLREMNNPLPRWWMWLFVHHHRLRARLPGAVSRASAASPGSLGWTSARRVRGRAGQGGDATWRRCTPRTPRMPAETLASDPQAMAIGERLFLNNCAQCHGSDARGSKGFPEPDRQRLAVRRHAREDRARRSPTAATASCRRWRRRSAAPDDVHERRATTC